MALGRQVVNLLRPDIGQQFVQVGRIGHVAVVEAEPGVVHEVVDPLGIEIGCPADQAVHLIALVQEQFAQKRAILTCDPGDECFLHAA